MAGEASLKRAGGVQVRLLICDMCRSVWPTERDPAQGGSRSDGEPCAYRWPSGKVCAGTVHPVSGRPAREQRYNDDATGYESARAAYSGAWCTVLGVPWGTTSLALVRQRYRELAKVAHPDVGGDHRKMVELNDAYRQALAELGQKGVA